MKIFDCFMYFDEEMVLDIRLNILDAFVDHFVIVESKYNHKGEKRKLLFNKEKFSKFENKIIYLIYDEIPSKVTSIKFNDSEKTKNTKYIMNALYRENEQRNYIINGLTKASDDDIIFVSDVDEIPDLSKVSSFNPSATILSRTFILSLRNDLLSCSIAMFNLTPFRK